MGLINCGAVALARHGFGDMLAMLLADDLRMKTTVIHNSGMVGVFPDNPPLVMHEQRQRGMRSRFIFGMLS